jgi:hypothetical protein
VMYGIALATDHHVHPGRAADQANITGARQYAQPFRGVPAKVIFAVTPPRKGVLH